MKVVVAVIIYDRAQNLTQWLRLWAKSNTQEAELVICHNFRNEAERHHFHSLCQTANVRYIARENKGFDIGAFQDVCRNRIPEFPQKFEFLLWCTDDLQPVRPTFIQEFLKVMERGVSAACYEVSKEVKPHIRTTGFMLRREHLARIRFNVDPITTKIQCYEFEHRDKANSLIDQMSKLGRVLQVGDVETSPVWDKGHGSREAKKRFKRREQEQKDNFKGAKPNVIGKVVFICPIYNQYPEIIGSLINQTHKNWELILVHDGPSETFDIKSIVEAAQDDRIKYKELPERTGNFGHKIRQEELKNLTDGDYVVITNGDNFHAPVYIEWMLKGFVSEGIVACYCSHMIHSYIQWGQIPCRLEQGYVDCAGVMVRRTIAQEVGWNDTDAHSADWLYFQDIINRFSIRKWVMVQGCLLVHN